MGPHHVATSFANPIIPGSNPDPSIVRVNDDFFLVTSSFEYFPGVPIYHSTDLSSWKLIGHALTRTSQLQIHTPETGGGVWAATLRFHNGYFYVVTASFEHYRPQEDDRVWPLGFYVRTDNIWDSSSWSDPVYFDQIGFDQDLFWDDDGTVYLSQTRRKKHRTPGAKLKDFAVHICPIDLKTGASLQPEPRLIKDSASGVCEGSHIIKRGKYYYLFTAEGGTESGHSECVSRSDKGPYGPWVTNPNNPLCHNGREDDVQNVGHADLVEDSNGNWWAVLLGVRPVKTSDGTFGQSVLGRETFLVPVDWVDDWPVFNHGKKLSLQSDSPQHIQEQNSVIWSDTFSKPSLQLGWYRKNTPRKHDFSLTERPGCLRLFGGPYMLRDPSCPTLFLRKQTERFCTWQTCLFFVPSSESTEAGTVVWMDHFTHGTIGIRLKRTSSGSLQRIIRFSPPANSGIEVAERKLERLESDVILQVVCGEQYKFGFKEVLSSDDNRHEKACAENIIWMGGIANDVITRPPPIGAQFTGAMLGLYSFGEHHPCYAVADFHYVNVTSS